MQSYKIYELTTIVGFNKAQIIVNKLKSLVSNNCYLFIDQIFPLPENLDINTEKFSIVLHSPVIIKKSKINEILNFIKNTAIK